MGQAGNPAKPSKTIGVTGEALFAFRALEEGLVLSVPVGDNSTYDFLVDNGSRISRVQIKSSTSRATGRPAVRYDFVLKHRSSNSKYDIGKVDVFGLVVIPERLIYIVPFSHVSHVTKCTVYLAENTTSKMAPYKERWDYL